MAENQQDVIFLPGIRQDVNRLAAPPGTLIDAQNVRYLAATGIGGRSGTRAIAQTDDIGASAWPLLNRAIGLVDRTAGYGVIGTTRETARPGILMNYDAARSRFGFLGYHSRALPAKRRGGVDANALSSNFGSCRYAVAANSLGYVMFCGVTTFSGSIAGIRILVQDPTGGPFDNLALAGRARVSCLALGTRFVVVYQVGTTLTAYDFDIPASGTATVSPQLSTYTVGTLTSSSAFWDICPDSTGANWYLVFQNGAATIRADRFAAGATVSNANTTTACTGTVPVTAYHNSTGLWIGYHDNPGVTGAVTFRVAQSNLSGFVAAAVVITTSVNASVPLIGPNPAVAAGALAVCRSSSAVAVGAVATRPATLTSSSSTLGADIAGVSPLSKPTAQGQLWVMTGAPQTNCRYQRAVLISSPTLGLNNSPELVMPETERANTAYMPNANPDMFATEAVLPSGNAVFIVPELLQRSASGSFPDAIQLALVEYQPSCTHKDAISGSGVVVAGQPVEAPGQGATRDTVNGGSFELGFVERPYVISATAQNSASGVLTLSATYSWVFVIEWADALGRRHRSAPSAPVTVTLAGAEDAVDFVLSMAQITQRVALTNYGRPRIVAYRTLANQPDVYYRETTPNDGVGVLGSLSYSRTCGNNAAETDALIAQNERVYTDGGVRETSMAPACRYLCESEDRVWCGGLWDPRVIQASKIIVPGEPLQFTDDLAFQAVIPDEVTGLAYLDGNVIAFCEQAIYVVSGDGPNDQGAGSFSPPRAICRDLGCIDYRSIVETSVGVFFQSTRGIYLLPRGLGNPVFVGMAIQDIMSPQVSGFSRVLAAVSSQDSLNRTVRFLVENPTSLTTRVLVYDLDIAQADPEAGWSYDTFNSRLSCLGNWPTGVFLSLYSLSSASICGYLDEAVPTFLTDASDTQDITSAVQTADLRFAGLAGQWRCDTVVGVMAEPTTGATVTITVTCDGLTPDTRSWALTTATGAIYRQVTPAQPQCTAVSVLFSVARTAARGPNFHGVTLELQPQPGTRRTDSTER
jgi:hypothetical protein